MAEEIIVTVADESNSTLAVDSDAVITVEDVVVNQQNNVADETPLTVTQEADAQVSITSDILKETYKSGKFTGNTGENVELVLGFIFRVNSLTAFLNGILMEKDVDYTEGANRDRITVLNTLVSADKIEARYVIN